MATKKSVDSRPKIAVDNACVLTYVLATGIYKDNTMKNRQGMREICLNYQRNKSND